MAHTTTVLVLFLVLPGLSAFQTSLVQNGAILEYSLADNAFRTFVSANKIWCGQAPPHIAEDALRLYKSMPRGKLYEGMSVNNDGGCEQLGYKLSTGEDPCYPGLQTFYRNEDQQNKFANELQMALREYGEFTINLEDAELIDSCRCKNGSFARNFRGNSCKQASPLSTMVERNPFRTFVSTNKMFCAQARQHTAKRALDLYKSMPRSRLYDGAILLNVTSCKSLGYHWSTGEDPCFPGLQTFYRNDEEQRRFMAEFQTILKKFGEIYDLALEDTSLMDSCKCEKGSIAKNYRGNSCQKVTKLEKKMKNKIDPQCTFVSMNRMWCAQARSSVAIDAFNMYKSMPRSKLYDGIVLKNATSCELIGYTWNAGEDPCYPGLQTFYRNEREKDHFMHAYEKVLNRYGKFNNLSLNDVYLLDSCKCKHNSYAKKYRGSTCDNVSAPQESIGVPNAARQRISRAFVSANKLWCAQATTRIAEGALSLYRAMPRGQLFDHANYVKSCEQSGFNLSAGEDPCYPGLQTFYRNKYDKRQFFEDYEQTLKNFAEQYHLTLEDVNLMDSCVCHVDSVAVKYRGQSCDVLKKMEASWIHEDHTGRKNACAGGPYVLLTRALAVLKSTEHQSDQIRPMQCDKLGWPFRPAKQNKCFTGLRFWSDTNHSNIDVLNLENSSCQCAPNSELGKKVEQICHSRRNHIRDWWKE